MKIGNKYRQAVHTDSTSSLETIGVLGDTVVDINSKSATGAPVQNNAELKTNETPNLSDVIKSSQGTIEQLNTILAKVDHLADSLNSTKGSIGELINSPELYNRALTTLNELSRIPSPTARAPSASWLRMTPCTTTSTTRSTSWTRWPPASMRARARSASC
jgi:phospholipid/cholesterol/gamma-HCH transport system substrate-binding protein